MDCIIKCDNNMVFRKPSYDEMTCKDLLFCVYDSFFYTMYCFLMIVACVFLFSYLLFKKGTTPTEQWFVWIDTVVNALFVIELCLRLLAFRGTYFRSNFLAIDVSFCLFMFVVSFDPLHKALLSVYQKEIVDVVILLLRHMFYLIRILHVLFRVYVQREHCSVTSMQSLDLIRDSNEPKKSQSTIVVSMQIDHTD